MKIAIVLPRKFQFSVSGATAIDSCARDFAASSQHHRTIVVYGSAIDAPFPGLVFRPIAATGKAGYVAALIARLQATPPDVILVEQRVDVASALARNLPTVPVAVRRHGRTEGHGWAKRLRHGWQLKPIARFFWVSEFSAQSFIRDYPASAPRVRITGNGIDTDHWRPAAAKEPIVAFAGRAAPEKGLDDFAAALALVLAARPAWRGAVRTVVGNSAERAYADAARQRLASFGDRIDWVENAPRDAVRALFARARIVVIPSNVPEGFPLAAVEAMASAAAVVHCGLGGLPEVMGDAGVVPQTRNAETYASAIAALMDDDASCDRLARAARARVESRFKQSAAAARIDDELARMLGERRD